MGRVASSDELLGGLADGRLSPVYILQGSERYLMDRAVAAIREAALGPGAQVSAFNQDVFDLKESGLGPVLVAAKTLPMFVKRKLVIARGLDDLKAADLEALPGYLGSPNDTTCLVFTADKLDLRLKAFQAAKKSGVLYEFPSLRDRELASWLMAEAKRRGVRLAQDAASLLSELAGPDLGRLAQSLEQLTLYVGEAKAITSADVEELVSETRQRNVFELTRAIGEGDATRATRLLHKMLANREPALRIQFMLIRQLRQIWRAKEMTAERASRNDIAAAIGVPPFALDEILAPARRLNARTLVGAFERFYRNDRAMKSTRVDADLLLSRAVERLCDEIRGHAGHTR